MTGEKTTRELVYETNRDVKWICRALQRMEAQDEEFEARIRALEGWRAEKVGEERRLSTVSAGAGGVVGGVVAVHCAPSPIGTAIATGGLSGLLAGAVFLAWAWFSTGGLGVDRFATVGPRWPEVLIGVGILVGSAVTAAVITWFVRAARSSAD